MVDDLWYSVLIGVTAGFVLVLMAKASVKYDEYRDFSYPYKELVENVCPDTQPQVYIDSSNLIRIVYDCTE